ncbi:MAG TPA: apolipoprotein N-acyltransferase [Bdellovibrionota bacterium]|nr:apolipoprotein N-acyltransferase [Bdellovibrionota bacterium]
MNVLLSALGGILLALAFPRYELVFLTFFAFIPYFYVLEKANLKKAFLYGTLFGWAAYLLSHTWIAFTVQEFGGFSKPLAILTYIFFSLGSGTLFGFFGVLSLWLRKTSRLSWLIIYPVTYTVVEYLFPRLFPWYLASPFYKQIYFIQIVDIFGVYGMSFFIIFINVTFYQLILCLFKKREFPWIPVSISILLSFAIFGYGYLRVENVLEATTYKKPFEIALLQTNVGNFEKSIEGQSHLSIVEQAHERNLSMIKEAAILHPDLIVLPETAVPGNFNLEQQLRLRYMQEVSLHQTPLYLGSYAEETYNGEVHYFNSSYLITPIQGIVGRYNKIYLLMFGEYLPLSSVFPSIKDWIKEVSNFTPGTRPRVFSINGEKLGALICYEDLIPSHVRKTVRKGATFLLNIANDSWFGKTACPYQHLALSVFRSVEHKVPLVRGTNTGISSFIEPTGEITQASELQVKTILHGGIKTPGIKTFYTRFGDWFPLLNCLFLLLALFPSKGEDHNVDHPSDYLKHNRWESLRRSFQNRIRWR